MEKTCTKCKRILSLECFGKDKRLRDGLQTQCKGCTQKRYNRWYTKKTSKETKRQWKAKNPYVAWASTTLSAHRIRGCEVLISTSELKAMAEQARYCKICGCELNWIVGKGKIMNNSPSLDRTDNTAVMATGNVQIVCCSCNTTKRDRSMDEFIEYCRLVIRRYNV